MCRADEDAENRHKLTEQPQAARRGGESRIVRTANGASVADRVNLSDDGDEDRSGDGGRDPSKPKPLTKEEKKAIPGRSPKQAGEICEGRQVRLEA